jgi:hypothetical protein
MRRGNIGRAIGREGRLIVIRLCLLYERPVARAEVATHGLGSISYFWTQNGEHVRGSSPRVRQVSYRRRLFLPWHQLTSVGGV